MFGDGHRQSPKVLVAGCQRSYRIAGSRREAIQTCASQTLNVESELSGGGVVKTHNWFAADIRTPGLDPSHHLRRYPSRGLEGSLPGGRGGGTKVRRA